ncbi:unnamed protein product [Thlaspi arvense]|uniref:RWP-RK domain-containing protein n=1 Tax=Thlaspi arvense TaxID=13288 RepID=A0AAU9SV15_THLAR|nr:unnamed protein product [Thlaspi arvense]
MIQDLLNVINSPNPNLMDLSFTVNPLSPLPPPPPTPTTENIDETGLMQELSLSFSNCDTNEFLSPPLQDDSTPSWDMGLFDIPSDDLDAIINYNVLEQIGNDNGNNVVETGRLEPSTRVFAENGTNFETGGSSATPVPAITPITSGGVLVCNCCNLLRRVYHSNGQEMLRFDIFGGIGYFCHAVLETRRLDGSNESTHLTYHLTDLTMEEVRLFLEDYFSAREASGYVITSDTDTDFFQAMNACFCNNQSFMSTLPPRDDVPMSLAMPDETLNVPHVPQYVGLRDEPPVPKKKQRRRTALAVQDKCFDKNMLLVPQVSFCHVRERTGKLTLKDISMHFHLPIEQAARKMSLCPTVVKKICRRGGLYRWPHRKIKSLLKKIELLKSVLSSATDDKGREHAEQQIEKLEQKIAEICSEILKNFKTLQSTLYWLRKKKSPFVCV